MARQVSAARGNRSSTGAFGRFSAASRACSVSAAFSRCAIAGDARNAPEAIAFVRFAISVESVASRCSRARVAGVQSLA